MEAVRRREPVKSAWFAAEALGKLGSNRRMAIAVLREAAKGEVPWRRNSPIQVRQALPLYHCMIQWMNASD